jgi:hypothetical protein
MLLVLPPVAPPTPAWLLPPHPVAATTTTKMESKSGFTKKEHI